MFDRIFGRDLRPGERITSREGADGSRTYYDDRGFLGSSRRAPDGSQVYYDGHGPAAVERDRGGGMREFFKLR